MPAHLRPDGVKEKDQTVDHPADAFLLGIGSGMKRGKLRTIGAERQRLIVPA